MMMTEQKTTAELRLALEQKDTEIRTLRKQLQQVQKAQPPRELSSMVAEAVNLEQFLFMVQEVFSAVILTDEQNQVVWINKNFTSLSGFELSDVVGQQPTKLLAAELRDPAVIAQIKEGIAHQKSFQYEALTRHKRGQTFWVNVKAHPILNKDGALIMFAAVVEDISDAKRAQLKLIASEHRFRDLTENVPGVLYQTRHNYDGTSRSLYLSPKVADIFGMTAEQARSMVDYLHPDDKDRWVHSMADSRAFSTSWFFEGRLLVPGQPERWCRCNAIVSSKDKWGLLYSGIILDITPIKKAEEALRESEVRWRMAVEGFGDGVWEYNFQSGKALFSKTYLAMLGYEEGDLPNTYESWYENVHPDDRETVTNHGRANLLLKISGSTTSDTATEYRMRCKNGSYLWVMGRAAITKRDDQGQPLIVTCLHTNISKVKEAEMALSASEQRLSTTIANFQEAVVLEDAHQTIVLANEAFCRMYKLPTAPDQLVGQRVVLLMEEVKDLFSDENSFMRRYEEVVQTGQLVTGDTLILKDGRILQRDYTPIYTNGEWAGALWKIKDITQQTKDVDKLIRREAKYRNIIEKMNLGLMEADLNERVLYANRSYCDLLGFEPDELVGTSAHLALLDSNSRALLHEKVRSRTHGVSDTYEISLVNQRGEQKYVLVTGAPLYDDHRRIVGSIGIHLDVTEQKQLDSKLRAAKEGAEESSKAKERFLANMSHEIRTPMNAILGMSQLMAKTPLDGQQGSYLHAIRDSAENLLVIINDILDLSKIEAGKMTVEMVGFQLNQLLAQVAKTLYFKVEEKGLSFVTQMTPALSGVLIGDPYRIIQVLLNLAGNAIKFTERGEVSIGCELIGRQDGAVVVEFRVTDTGVGIDPEYLAHVYKEFSQEDLSTSRKFGGTGLGLSICKNLVQLMGGQLEIESEKNKGTTSHFQLVLPIGGEEDLPAREHVAVTPRMRQLMRGKRVLLVEDNEYNRLLAKSFLKHANLIVTEAENGAVAVELLHDQEFDLILMDVQMPVMNGFEATQHIREELELVVPIVALTANAIRGESQKCLAAGMNDYLAKPFHESDLLKIVCDWLLDKEAVAADAALAVAGVLPTPAAVVRGIVPVVSVAPVGAVPMLTPPATASPTAPLFRLEGLIEEAEADQDFIAAMLQIFIRGNEEGIESLQTAMVQQDVAMLRAAAHKIIPSLAHLEVEQALIPMRQLNAWTGDFSQPALQQLVDECTRVLRLVNTQIVAQTARPMAN